MGSEEAYRLAIQACRETWNEKTVKQIEEALKQEPFEDAISRKQAVYTASGFCHPANVADELRKLPPVNPQPKTGRCKDCKWWKDSDGVYRRGVRAESQCPINRREVFEGTGYCYMYEPQESEEQA